MLEQALVLNLHNKTTIICRVLSLQKLFSLRRLWLARSCEMDFLPRAKADPRQGKCFIIRDELFKDLSSLSIFSAIFFMLKSGFCKCINKLSMSSRFHVFGDNAGRKRRTQKGFFFRGDVELVIVSRIEKTKNSNFSFYCLVDRKYFVEKLELSIS